MRPNNWYLLSLEDRIQVAARELLPAVPEPLPAATWQPQRNRGAPGSFLGLVQPGRYGPS